MNGKKTAVLNEKISECCQRLFLSFKIAGKKMGALFLMFALPMLTGCKVGPNYHAPELLDQGCFVDSSIAQEAVIESEGAEPSEWWIVFEDPQLEQYIYESAEYNYDVRIAACNILQARAQQRINASALYPQIDGDVSYDHYFFGVDLTKLFPAPGPIPLAALKDININLTSYGFDFNWEVDLFGRIRRQVESAYYQVGAAIEDRRDILISVFGEVAKNYLQIRSDQAQIQVIQDALHVLEHKLELTSRRQQKGVDAELKVSQAEADVASLRAQLPPLIADYYTSIYRLSVLTGRNANDLVPEFFETKPLPCIPEVVSVGLCCRLLERRPDVRYAERELAAATANIGVAVANFYPNISLKGFLGLLSIDGDIINANNIFEWSAGGGVLAPLFHGGKIRANLQGVQAQAAAACLNYEKTILNAVQEVESAIAHYTMQRNSAENLRQAETALGNVFELSDQLYQKGMRDQISLLDAEYNFLKMKNSALQSHAAALIHLVTLYKALGGGWEVSP